MSETNIIPNKFYSKKDVSEILDLSIPWLDKRISEGDIKYYKFKGAIKFKGEDIIDFIERSKVDGS